ncbi:MAG: UDP-4-amino-4,6-dideoxy-N-acetyl-beta-L-altrosamine transaminase [Pseudomonadota bacterium]
MIPYGKQDIGQADIDAVIDVLKSDWLTQGPAIERFERSVADYCGARYAVAVSNGTAALHLACLALDIGEGQEVWTSPNTFVASANCARYCGADVDFVDIDSRTYNLSTSLLESKLAQRSNEGRKPAALIPVHFAGQPCDMEAIGGLAKRYSCAVIEDASHAIGSSFAGRKTGSCDYSDMVVFSFHPVKIVTSGEGGMILTNRDDLYQRLLRLRTHGITRNAADMTELAHGPWYYQQTELGYNYRITDIQAALGASQMQRLEEFVTRREYLACRYDVALADLPLIRPWQDARTRSSWHLYVVRLRTDSIRPSHREVFESLRAAGIGVNLHYIPVHTQPYYQALGFKSGMFPEAERYYREAISLPMYASLSDQDQDHVIAALHRILK